MLFSEDGRNLPLRRKTRSANGPLFPDYNCGVAGGPDITIVDSDRVSRLKELCGDNCSEWFSTYSVSSGRPDRAHFYFRTIPEVLEFGNKKHKEPGIDGNIFEVKTRGAQVTAEGSTHPDTGGVYKVTQDLPLLVFPIGLLALLRELYVKDNPTGKREWNLPVHDGEGRDDFLIQQAGRLRNAGASETIIRAHLGELNEDPEVMADPKTDEDLDRIARSAARYDVPAPEPVVIIGGSKQEEKTITDWRERYHTKDEMENAPPVSFLIDGFLPADAITALAAPVGQRKSLAAANVAHALCTKEALFDHFAVSQQPTRVLYLCPEMGLRSFTDRIRKLGLMPYVRKTLFCRTMSAEGTLDLNELTVDELTGAVVIIDTAVRYLKGDENSSEHMRQFAESIFRLMRDGAVSVLLLHHSAKGTKESSELTLENAMRGSGELGAFVATCWATRLQNPTEPYQSASYFVNVKQRDFESKPFEVTSGPDCRLHIVDVPGDNVKLSSKAVGSPSNADGNEETALQVIRDNPTLSQRAIALKLKELGIQRSKSWIGDKRYELLHKGVKSSA